jgi:hypothetical protein
MQHHAPPLTTRCEFTVGQFTLSSGHVRRFHSTSPRWSDVTPGSPNRANAAAVIVVLHTSGGGDAHAAAATRASIARDESYHRSLRSVLIVSKVRCSDCSAA